MDSMVENHSALLTKTEIQWLLGNVQPSRGYERKIRYSINRKITTLTKLELPLLARRGFNVTIHCNSVTARSNARRGSAAAAVGCGVANPAGEVHYIREEDGAGSGTFVPPSSSISNPRVLSDMGLAIPRPTRLGDPRSSSFLLLETIISLLLTVPFPASTIILCGRKLLSVTSTL
jgi:hypothetical protein